LCVCSVFSIALWLYASVAVTSCLSVSSLPPTLISTLFPYTTLFRSWSFLRCEIPESRRAAEARQHLRGRIHCYPRRSAESYCSKPAAHLQTALHSPFHSQRRRRTRWSRSGRY